MKNLKIITVPIIACLLFLTSCENDSQENITENDKINNNELKEFTEFDFSKVDNITKDEILDIEQLLIEESKNVSLAKELKNYEGEENVDHSIINDYLKYQGRKTINTEEYFIKSENVIKNTDSKVDEFVDVLKEFNVYTDAQLRLFKELDALMITVDNFDQAVETLHNFERKINSDRELNNFEKNSMLLYTSTMRSLMYTDYNIQKGLWDCVNCVWKNKWRILGWGVFRSLPKVVGCIFSNLSNGGAMFWCILRALGSGVAYTFKHYCGSVC